MAKDEKLTRQELKEDQFVSMATIVIEWIAKHRTKVITAVITVVVLVSIVEVGKWWIERRNASASVLLFDALKVGADDEARAEGKAEAKLAPEKRDEAIKAFERVIAEYPSAEVGKAALLQITSLKLDKGDADGALATVERFLKETGADHKFRPLALELKGYALLKKGDHKGAAEAFRQLADMKTAVGKDYALFDLGTALEKSGDKKGAAEAYRRIPAEVPRSPLKERATARADDLDPQQKAKVETKAGAN